MWTKIARQISQATGQDFQVDAHRSVGGGCINQCYQLQGNDQTYFVKVNQPDQAEMFRAEALGLEQMRQTNTILVPKPVCWGIADSSSYIVMEWLEFSRADGETWEKMGHQLAAMDKAKGASQYGWDYDNTIGSTPQINTWTKDWAEFFAQQRIGYQLKLARRRGEKFPDYHEVIAAVKEKLYNRQPFPSLVHGDLWSGNAAATASGEPVILDPATYWGDREVDIAMTELFSGFPAAFYRGYNQAWQLDQGYQQRKTIYNLYHILNHFNLFGGGYGSQASRMIAQIMA